MTRFLAGAAACFLFLTGAFLLWQGHAANGPNLPAAPSPRLAAASDDTQSLFSGAPAPLEAPEATPKSREEKRFGRADKNKDGKIEAAEVLAPRQKAFAKLDADHNGSLSFQEWAVKTITKFQGADHDRSGWLTPAEYATTAPPPPKHKTCACKQAVAQADE